LRAGSRSVRAAAVPFRDRPAHPPAGESGRSELRRKARRFPARDRAAKPGMTEAQQ
jgi:hypothetical protein